MSNTLTILGENLENASLLPGMPVSSDGVRGVYMASAGIIGRFPVVGLVIEMVSRHTTPSLCHLGFLELPTWEWATGSVSLSARAMYFLSVVPGRLTTNPNEGGCIVSQLIGRAVTAQKLQLTIREPILL